MEESTYKNKRKALIMVISFLAILLFFTSLSLFLPKKDFSEAENRELQTLPELSFETISDGTFQEKYNTYLSDQFEFRDFWVAAKTKLLLALGKKDINGIYFSSGGYLIEKYTEADFDPELIDSNIKNLAGFADRTAELDINTVSAFIPSKSEVLTDKLPKFASAYDTSFVFSSFEEAVNDSVKTLDLSKILKLHCDDYIYFKTDHHWTALGAYYAYREIVKEFGIESIDLEKFASNDVTTSFLGSDYDKVRTGSSPDTITVYDTSASVTVDYFGEADGSDTLYQFDALKTKNKYDCFLGGNYARVDINTDSENEGTLLILKDSYTNSIVPFLANHFSKIILIDLRFYNDDLDDLIAEDYTINDVLILLNTEKFMNDQNMFKLELVDESDYLDEEEMAEQERILAELDDE